jgi:hypothetical protein
MSDEASAAAESQLNDQAVGVATTVLSDSVIAATRCEQVTQDMTAKAAGVGSATRGMARFGKKLGDAMMPSLGNMSKGLTGGGLPGSFVLAVTKTQVAAIEDKRDGDKLVPGNVLKSWPREGFTARLDTGAVAVVSGVPEDRQVLILYLPLDGSKSKYLAAAAEKQAALGSPGQPTKFMIAKDAASNALAQELASSSPQAGPMMMVGGAQFQPGAPAATDSTAQLAKLAELHQSGALTDAEFAAQKAKIIGS